MQRALPTLVIIFGWFFGSTFLLVFTLGLYNQSLHTQKLDVLVKSISQQLKPSLQIYSPTSSSPTLDLISAITAGDARGVLIDRYLQKQHSPMQGLGDYFVKIADQYGLDWRLVPAIAQKESGMGKAIPKGSYNAWGWAIFTGKNSGAEFDNWQHGIETVTRGLKNSYLNQGLDTPEKIMTKYTPSSDGSWAADVRFTMDQIASGS